MCELFVFRLYAGVFASWGSERLGGGLRHPRQCLLCAAAALSVQKHERARPAQLARWELLQEVSVSVQEEYGLILFVIKNVSVICSAGAMCLFWYSLCHRANVRGYKRQCRKRGLLLHPQGRRPVSQLHVSWRRAWDVRRRAVWAATRLPALPQGSQRVLQVHLPRSWYYHRIRTHPTGYKPPPVCNDHQWLEAFQCS